MTDSTAKPSRPLRRGWTTGACAAAAVKAAYTVLLRGRFPDPVRIVLPGGQTPAFALALKERSGGCARAGVIKDAGDDPDVTHGALIVAAVRLVPSGRGVTFRAGRGVGIVTRPGLPVAPGEPAINPAPRAMIRAIVRELAVSHGASGAVDVEISVPNGEALARNTWNPRLGITGGLSILGTTGIVIPFSCAAWIASIRSGIDVARAARLPHIVGATGKRSEDAAGGHFNLPESALIGMGDFVGGFLKYLRRHPVARVTVAGGFAKISKMAQGALDLHSKRSPVDFTWLANEAANAGASPELQSRLLKANTASEARQLAAAAGIDLAAVIAGRAVSRGRAVLEDAPVALDVLIIDRQGRILAHAG